MLTDCCLPRGRGIKKLDVERLNINQVQETFKTSNSNRYHFRFESRTDLKILLCTPLFNKLHNLFVDSSLLLLYYCWFTKVPR